MTERGTIDAVFMLKRLQEENHAKQKNLCMCFVYQKRAFDIVPRKVLQCATKRKGIPEDLVRSVSLHEGAREESEWIMSCQRSLRLKWGYLNDLRCHLFFEQLW